MPSLLGGYKSAMGAEVQPKETILALRQGTRFSPL